MSFDAGEIIAYLKLDRSKFNEELDKALAEADAKTKDGIEVKVKPVLDEADVEKVLAEEEPLREDIEPQVKPTYAKGEAEQVGKTLAADILQGAEGGGGNSNLVKALLGQGLSEAEMGSALRGLGFNKGEIEAALANAFGSDVGGSGGSFAAQEIVKSILPSAPEFENALRGGINDLEKNGGLVAVRRDFLGMLNSIFGPGGAGSAPWDALSASGPAGLLLNPLGAGALVALTGALGAAAGGGLAATAIGSGGTLAALLPGLLDLQKGLAAYTAQSTGASTKGMSGAQLGLGKAIGGLMGAGSKGIGAAETLIMPQIEKFIAALTKAIPLMNQFAKPAIAAMSGFFGAIDRGLGSGGFKSFVGDMSKLVGPIMTEFGKVILNLGGALGGFLKLFGPVGKNQIGPWFVKITGEFDKFMNHVKLGNGFIEGMVTVFSNLGKVLGAVWPALLKLGEALAPIGLQVFRIVGWMAEWVGRVVKLIPTDLITAILAVVIGLKAFSVVMGIITAIADANPIVLIGVAVVALGLAIYELVKHWRAVWDFIKKITVDAWNFLDDLLHNKFVLMLMGPTGALILLGEHWKTIWGDIQIVMERVWGAIKPIFDAIKTAIGGVLGGIGKVVGVASSLGGGVVGGITKGIGAVVSFFGGFLANGGPASAGTPYIVGEQGPELFVPSTAGTVVPHGKFGGNNITFQIDARGHSNPQAVMSAVRSGIGATLPSLQAALARGAA